MRDRLRARADRVVEQCDLGQLLYEYGYSVVPDRHREQQFSCDLHGPDHKPSARYYGPSNTTYCWVCQKTRDAISYVQEKEHVGFREAIETLERRLGLDPLPWEDDRERGPTPQQEQQALARPTRSFEEERRRMEKFLDGLTRDRLDERPGHHVLDCPSLLSYWEAFDRIDYGVAKENWPEAKGSEGLRKLYDRVLEKIKRAEGSG